MSFASMDKAMARFSGGLYAFNVLFPRWGKLRRSNPSHAELVRIARDARQTANDLISAATLLESEALGEIDTQNTEARKQKKAAARLEPSTDHRPPTTGAL